MASSDGIDVDALSPEEIDGLDTGVVGLDGGGAVVLFNAAASALSGIAPEDALGRDFFRHVMPATAVPGFLGRFLSGVRRGDLDAAFDFVFGRVPQPLLARVRMHGGRACYWLTIEPLESLGAGRSREAVMAAVGRRSRAEPVDPGLCEREPIHVPGSVQPNAVLLAADGAAARVLAYSANAADLLRDAPAPLDGQPMDAVLPRDFVEALRARLAAGSLGEGRTMHRLIRVGGAPVHACAHAHAGRVLVELELAPEHPEDFGAASQIETEAALARLRGADTMTDAARIAAAEVRALTGFECVLVYRFDADWNGEAVAEDKVPDWSRALVGLRFPASDIPAQARALYTKAKSRFVIDRDCVPVPLVVGEGAGNGPVDLTFAQHRTLSPIHLEYQRNLGVDGSMSISIMVEGRLWGLMIGHHRRPHYVAVESRAAAGVLTDAFAMRVQEIEARRLWAERQHHLDVEGQLVRTLTGSDDFVAALTGGPVTLLDLFAAGGAGVVSGERVTLLGATPPAEAVRETAAWLRERLPPGEAAYTSSAAPTQCPPLAPHGAVASGVLAAFVDRAREHLLVWFRPETPRTVTWGGDPRKPVLAGSGPVAVLPRRSFERWVEERSGTAAPFAAWTLSLALSLAEAVEGVVLRQHRRIADLTGLLAEKERLLAQKDLLTKEIDHRVKNSLQIVSAFLQMQRRHVADAEARQAFADTSARVMSVARVHDSLYQADSFEEVDIGQTLESLCRDLGSLAGEDHAVDLTAERGLMVPYRKAVALSLIATELVTNAFKYAGGPSGMARVEVSVRAAGPDSVRLTVRDDGKGLPPDWAEGGPRDGLKGTGLGMKLIRAMLDQIDARLDVADGPGACFTITA